MNANDRIVIKAIVSSGLISNGNWNYRWSCDNIDLEKSNAVSSFKDTLVINGNVGDDIAPGSVHEIQVTVEEG